jgi:Flp pilus assembly protein TadB
MNARIALLAGFIAMLAAGTLTARAGVRRPAPTANGAGAPSRPLRFPTRRHTSTTVTPTALATWADDLARTLRHGSTLRAALSTVPPADASLAPHTEPLRHWLGRGATVTNACDEWSDHLAHTAHRVTDRTDLLTTLSAVLASTAALGGTAAAPLDRFAATMRQRASDDLERSAQSAQAQMSARVLTIVPLAVLALLLLTDDEVRGVIARPTGGTVVLIGLTLNAFGAWWMRRIVGSTTPARIL